MKNRDAKMRERYLRKEDDRLQKKWDKELKKLKQKHSCSERTHKDEQEAEMIQRLINMMSEGE